jgi:hypothetical protein
MSAYRMPALDAGQPSMTADTQVIDGFVQQKLMVGGMGVMAGYAARPVNYAMDKPHRSLFIHQLFLVAVAGNAKRHRSFGPELIAMVISMGVMA